MVAFKVARGVGVAACVAMSLLLMAGAAAAQGAKLCLPAREGRPVVTPVKGVCPRHYTLTELGKEGPAGKEGKQGAAGKEGSAGKEGKQGPAGLSLLSEEEQKVLKAILPYIKVVASGVGGKPTTQVTGANLQVVSGSGKTDGPVNGAGNLIVGYDEPEPCAEEESCTSCPGKSCHEHEELRTGSNNLVVGIGDSYSSYGAILGGRYNTASGADSLVVGDFNTASGESASVSGGEKNTANTQSASVSGGASNLAGARITEEPYFQLNRSWYVYPSVTGGDNNTAEGRGASVSGGQDNVASHEGPYQYADASVSGGIGNEAAGPGAWVSGGEGNRAGTESPEGYNPGPSSVSGGKDNKAFGTWASVTGGEYNSAASPGASVSGGEYNQAGGEDKGGPGGCCQDGMGAAGASVSGGYKNHAYGQFSSILGGKEELIEVESEFAHFP